MYVVLIILGVIFAGLILLNVVAYRHAHAMLHFCDSGVRTQPPESLTFLQKARVLFSGVTIPRPENHTVPSDLGFSFTTHRFPSTDNIEIEGWYIPRPADRGLVVLFHGYSSSKAALLNIAKALYNAGYSTFLIDFRGSGGSAGSCTSVGFYEADDVMKTLEYVQTISQQEHIILYGQSMGGAAILRAISAKGLQPDLLILEGVFDRMLSTVAARFKTMGLPAFPSAHLLTFWGGQQVGFSAFKHNPADYASDVTCPALILHGEQDPRATIDQASNIFRNLRGPKHFERFPFVGHESCFDAAPEKWQKAVSEFLNEHFEQTDITTSVREGRDT